MSLNKSKMFALIHRGVGIKLGHAHNLHWYEVVLLPLAFVIVYPDRTLRLWFSNANRIYQFLLLELIAVGGLIAGTLLLRRTYPDLEWWMPISLVLFCVLVRVVLFCINSI